MTPTGDLPPLRRISVVGTSGSGKTTLARTLARTLGLRHVELDSIYHQPGWQELPKEEFRARVEEATRGDDWVIDGNYTKARDIVWRAADTVVWTDMPRRVVFPRIIGRTLKRAATREELWNGNRERPIWMLSPLPRHSIVAWSIATFGKNRRRYGDAMVDPAWAHLEFVRLRSPAEAKAWVARLADER
ncbi:MAG: adenylate kinase [Planctomycetota bacterium]